MRNRVVKQTTLLPSVPKPLKDKLIIAVNRVLIDNEYELTNNIQKVVKKSIRKILKKTDKTVKPMLFIRYDSMD